MPSKLQLPEPNVSGAGRQTPRISFLPREFDPELSAVKASEMIDLAAVAGLYLEPWQEIAAEGLTLTRADGKWAAFEAAIQANRQNGKGSIIEARQLAGLFVWGEHLQIYTAHEFKTAQEMFQRILFLVQSTPALDSMVTRVRTAAGEEAIEAQIKLNGRKVNTRLRFLARSTSSGRGFTGDTIYLDEAYKLKQLTLSAILPTMAARSVHGNPQIIQASSAGMADSEVQEKTRNRALAGAEERLAYMEWSAPAWDDLTEEQRQSYDNDVEAYYSDPETARISNPAYGLRISGDFLQAERAALDSEEFAREHLGIWAKLDAEVVIPAEWWAKAARDSVPTSWARVAFAVDVPPGRESACIAAAIETADGAVHLEILEQDYGTEWVPAMLAKLKSIWSPVAIVVDAGSAAGSLIPEVRRAGVRSKQVNLRMIGAACGGVYDLLREGSHNDGPEGRRLTHSDQEQLNDAVKAAKRRPLGTDGTLWAWSRKDTTADISPLVAATLALAGLQSRPVRSTPRRAVVL